MSPRHLQIALLRSLVTGDQGGGTTALKFLPLGTLRQVAQGSQWVVPSVEELKVGWGFEHRSTRGLGLEGTSTCSQLNQHWDVHP